MNLFQMQGNIHINQKKQQNPHQIAEIMKKTEFSGRFTLGGALNSVFFFFFFFFNFLNS